MTIGHYLAQKLQEEGCRLAAITLKRSTHEYIINQKEVRYEYIVNNDEVMSRPWDHITEPVTLAQICDALGVDSIWPYVASQRNHIRSYKDKYYYSYRQNVPDEGIIQYIQATFCYIKKIFNDFQPEFIIAPNFVALPHIMINLYAEKNNIRMVGVTDSKIRGVYLLVRNFFENKSALHDRLADLNSGKIDSPNRSRAAQYIREFREKFIFPDYYADVNKKKSLYKTVRYLFSPLRQIFNWYVHRPVNYWESIGISLDYRPPHIILRDHFCQMAYKRYMDKKKYYPLDQVKRFVYMPLQYQPESTIDVTAPFFNNQIEMARLIAMSLPDDYTLVVKEHPAMVGLRPPSYIEKIERTANVKLIDYRITNDVVLKRSDLVIGPVGTTFTEAAFLRKPAIQLGNLGTTLMLPNMVRHTDMSTLASRIKGLLSANMGGPEYERRLENYVAAVYDTGFDCKYIQTWESGGSDENKEILWRYFKNEMIDYFSSVGR